MWNSFEKTHWLLFRHIWQTCCFNGTWYSPPPKNPNHRSTCEKLTKYLKITLIHSCLKKSCKCILWQRRSSSAVKKWICHYSLLFYSEHILAYLAITQHYQMTVILYIYYISPLSGIKLSWLVVQVNQSDVNEPHRHTD